MSVVNYVYTKKGLWEPIAIGRVVPSLMTMEIVSGMEKHITEHCQLYTGG